MTEYTPTKWWKVVAPNGKIWCETSSEEEARSSMRPGDTLCRLFEKVEYQREWRPIDGYSA